MVYDLQKASLWKRVSAWLFDSILLSIMVVALAWLLSAALGYDKYDQQINDAYSRYEESYGVVFDISAEEYDALPPEDKAAYDTAYAALTADEEVVYAYNMIINLTMVIASVGILLAVLLWEFAIPLLLKNGQTLGKKIFGLCLVRVDGVKVTPVQLFVRTLLGKFTLEIMIPVYILLMLFWGIADLTGTLLLGAVLLAQFLCLTITDRHAALHDLIAGTAVADFGTQLIFENAQERTQYIARLHAEQAAKEPY